MKYLLLIIFLFQSCSHVKEIPQRRDSELDLFIKKLMTTPNHPTSLRIKRDGKKLNEYMKSKKKLNDTKKD